MNLHCDNCDKTLGTYLYGRGGIEERAWIGPVRSVSGIPDMLCWDCFYFLNPRQVIDGNLLTISL